MADKNEEIVYPDDSSLEVNANNKADASLPSSEDKPSNFLRSFRPGMHHLRGLIILLIALFIIIGSGLGYYAATNLKKKSQNITVNTQSLGSGTLSKLTNNLGNSGQIGQQLTISPNTTFRNGLAVQGAESVGNNLSVNGSAALQGPVTIGNSLNVHGDLSVNSNASFGGNLSVSGLVTAASLSVGSITISNLNFSGDLNFGGHLVPLGTVPDAVASVAASGGGVQISGNDTSGTITINMGNNPPFEAGEMAIITFHKAFNLTPQVEITPVNNQAAALEYFVSQSPTFFTIRTASIPSAGEVYIFNYFVSQ